MLAASCELLLLLQQKLQSADRCAVVFLFIVVVMYIPVNIACRHLSLSLSLSLYIYIYGSFSSVIVHEMGLPRKAKKKGSRDPGEESLEEAILSYFEGFWPC